MKKKPNMQDATLRNIRALKRRMDRAERQLLLHTSLIIRLGREVKGVKAVIGQTARER
jgi:hypothetical protein